MDSKSLKTEPLTWLIRSRASDCLLVVIILMVIGLGCTQKTENKFLLTNDPRYQGWDFFTYENIKIFHQPNHLQQDKFGEVARMYLKSIDIVTRTLKMPPYTDTLVVVYYTGYGQGREMTGRDYPFAQDSVIYFWLPSFLGPTLMQHLLPRWLPEEPKYQFLKHGLIALFDFSGQDYHKSTQYYIDQGQFMPLGQLAADTAINSDKERYQSAEAASFVAYVLANHGISMLMEMYRSRLPFDRMVEELFHLPVDSLEKRWLAFAMQSVPPDTAGQ